MNQAAKRAVMAVAVLSCAGLMAGCESMPVADSSYDAAAETAIRARVVAELREAQRLGLVTVGEDGFAWSTLEQEAMIAQAGQNAVTSVASRPN